LLTGLLVSVNMLFVFVIVLISIRKNKKKLNDKKNYFNL